MVRDCILYYGKYNKQDTTHKAHIYMPLRLVNILQSCKINSAQIGQDLVLWKHFWYIFNFHVHYKLKLVVEEALIFPGKFMNT